MKQHLVQSQIGPSFFAPSTVRGSIGGRRRIGCHGRRRPVAVVVQEQQVVQGNGRRVVAVVVVVVAIEYPGMGRRGKDNVVVVQAVAATAAVQTIPNARHGALGKRVAVPRHGRVIAVGEMGHWNIKMWNKTKQNNGLQTTQDSGPCCRRQSQPSGVWTFRS